MAHTQPAIVALFCEDIRIEKSETVTIVGVLPDNAAVPGLPGMFPKLGVYVRANFPVDAAPSSFRLRLEFPWEGTPPTFGALDASAIAGAVAKAKGAGNPTVGLITMGVFAPFSVQAAGQVRAIVVIDDDEEGMLAGHLNIVSAQQ